MCQTRNISSCITCVNLRIVLEIWTIHDKIIIDNIKKICRSKILKSLKKFLVKGQKLKNKWYFFNIYKCPNSLIKCENVLFSKPYELFVYESITIHKSLKKYPKLKLFKLNLCLMAFLRFIRNFKIIEKQWGTYKIVFQYIVLKVFIMFTMFNELIFHKKYITYSNF